jgi:hypothetical protein
LGALQVAHPISAAAAANAPMAWLIVAPSTLPDFQITETAAATPAPTPATTALRIRASMVPSSNACSNGWVERVNLDVERYAERRDDRQVWRNGDPWAQATTTVIVGVLPDSGRWYARWTGRGPLRAGDCVYKGVNAEHYARGTAGRWMRTVSGEWAEA